LNILELAALSFNAFNDVTFKAAFCAEFTAQTLPALAYTRLTIKKFETGSVLVTNLELVAITSIFTWAAKKGFADTVVAEFSCVALGVFKTLNTLVERCFAIGLVFGAVTVTCARDIFEFFDANASSCEDTE